MYKSKILKICLPLLTLTLIGCKNSASNQSSSQQNNQSFLKVNMNLDSKVQQQKQTVSSNQFTNIINYKITIKTVCGDKEVIQEIKENSTGILLEDKKDCTITIEKFSLADNSNFFLPTIDNKPLLIRTKWENSIHKIDNTSVANYRLGTEVKHIKNSVRTSSNSGLDLFLFENAFENFEQIITHDGDFFTTGINLKLLPAPNPTKKPSISYRKVNGRKQYKISLQNETKIWENCAIVPKTELGDFAWEKVDTAFNNAQYKNNCNNLILNQDDNWTSFTTSPHTIIYANVSDQGNSYKLLTINANLN